MPRASYNAADTRMVVVVMIVVALCYPFVIDTATVVRTKISGQHLQNVVLHGPKNTRVVRSTEGNEKDDERRYCTVSGKYDLPCAWMVYNQTTRIIDYIMENNCECPDNTYRCVRINENLQAGAYRYYCRQNTTADDIERYKDTETGLESSFQSV